MTSAAVKPMESRAAVASSIAEGAAAAAPSAIEDATAALLSMGFTAAEVTLALDGYDGKDMRVEELLASALRRLGMES